MRHFLAALLAFLCFARGIAAGTADTEAVLYSQPRLVIDTGLHSGAGVRIAAAPDAGVAVSGSEDKVLRVWSLADGRLLATIRVPSGPGNIGKINAVAISPDGSLIAAGGWTGPDAGPHSIYLFDANGTMVFRIGGLPSVVLGLAFAPDGNHLAATLSSRNGFRLYSKAAGWQETSRDENYRSDSYGVTFAPDGRVASSELSGTIRVYDRDGKNPVMIQTADAGAFGLAFSPDGASLAVGNALAGRVEIYDARTLAPSGLADLGGYEPESLAFVAWSVGGEALYAAGTPRRGSRNSVLEWAKSWTAPPKPLTVGFDTIMGVAGLPGDKLLAVSSDPWLGVIDATGAMVWERRTEQVNAPSLVETLAVSADGMTVDFNFGGADPVRMRFDVRTLALSLATAPAAGMKTPDQRGLVVRDWDGTNQPRLNEQLLSLGPRELSRSVATDAVRGRIVLGSDWHLAAYDIEGEEIWRRTTPSVAWAVNIADGGRLAVVAYGDGSIRWHDIDNNGAELLALLVTRPIAPGEPLEQPPGWIVWTPEGLFETAASSYRQLFWHVNDGPDAAARAFPASAIAGTHRPDVIPDVVPAYGTAGALGGSGFRTLQSLLDQVRSLTGAEVRPGARLHVLTVGVGELGAKAAQLRLDYAASDAADLATRLKDSQAPMFSEVRVSNLTDADARGEWVLDALDTLRSNMEASDNDGRDFAVIHFSGHGMYKDGRYYLLTYGSDAGRPNSIAATALDLGLVADKLHGISKLGRVLVLIDACRSNAYAADMSPLEANADYLGDLLFDDQVTVVMSSSLGQVSWERDEWENGAFTQAVLEALGKRADLDDDRVISTTEFVTFVINEVSTLTDGAQRPSVRVAYNQPMFFATQDAMQ